MRVLFVSTTAGYIGGVEQHIELATKGLASRGHVCAFAYSVSNGVDVDGFLSCFDSSYNLESTSLAQVLEDFSPDCIYVHKWEHMEEIQAVVGTTLPIFRMFHDHDIYCPRRHKYLIGTRKICTWRAGIACYFDLAFLERRNGKIHITPIAPKLRELARNRSLDRCIVGSSYMRTELVRNGFPAHSIHVVPPTVSDFNKPLVPIGNTGNLLYVGQLVRGKGVDILLKAFALTKRTGRLDIVGSGNDDHYLRNLAKQLGIDGNVHFHGWVAHEDLPDYYDAATVVVVPSRWPEPFGMVGIEAMLRQRPVVGAAVGGIPDWLEDGGNGLLFPVNDHRKLAICLDRLTGDGEYAARLGIEGRNSVLENFSFTTFIDRLERLLGEGIV